MITKEFYPKVNAAVVQKDHMQLFAEYYVKSISFYKKKHWEYHLYPEERKFVYL